MRTFLNRSLFYLFSFSACLVLALNTGCASGGYKITRGYAKWLNSQNIFLRIIIYLVATVVFAVTMLLDMVIFNTIDFWQGKVSAGLYEFKEGDTLYAVEHQFLPDSNLKQSTIKIQNQNKKLLQTIVLNETANGEIEMSVDGKLKTRVRDINTLPVVINFNEKGQAVEEKFLFFTAPNIDIQRTARL